MSNFIEGKMEQVVKRRKLSLKEKRLTIVTDKKEYNAKTDGNDRETDLDTVKSITISEEEILSFPDYDDDENITPELRDLRNKLFVLRHNRKTDDSKKELLQWPIMPEKMMIQDDGNHSEEATDREGTKTNTNKNSLTANDIIIWPKPCSKCLTMKPYPKINILEEALKNYSIPKDKNLEIQKNKPVLPNVVDTANFDLMDLAMSEDDMTENCVSMSEKINNGLNKPGRSLDTNTFNSDNNPNNVHVTSFSESKCQQEPLNTCPMCQLVFDGSYGTMDIDGHLAQCLAAAGDDDVAW